MASFIKNTYPDFLFYYQIKQPLADWTDGIKLSTSMQLASILQAPHQVHLNSSTLQRKL